MSEVVEFKFPMRSSDDIYDRSVSNMYDYGDFDTTLIASNNHTVQAHRFVLAMFSKYFLECLEEVDLEDGVAQGLYFYLYENCGNICENCDFSKLILRQKSK